MSIGVWTSNVMQVIAAGFASPFLVRVLDEFLRPGSPAWVPYMIVGLIGFMLLLIEPVQVVAVGFIFGVLTFAILMHQNPTLVPWIWPQDVRRPFF